ncbi:MAG TPA: hypothetical protein VGF07_09795 [Stellaceae bacterium]|jgi:hypothetical protein
MDDRFRLDLAGYDRAYIEEVLDTFVAKAPGYGRRVAEIRLSATMAAKLEVVAGVATSWPGATVVLADTGCADTIEVVLAAAH